MKRFILALCIASLTLLSPMTALASGDTPTVETTEDNKEENGKETTSSDTQTTETQTTEAQTPEEVAESIKANESKPFLALGKDLTDEQLDIVLGEMGISRDDLDDYRVVYITNDMEHEKLDSYIDPAVIGSVSLSCVMVKPNVEGYGIRVTTKNINYCTVSMYKNALLTAGVKDADVFVVGPFPISGTAALIGAWMAYEEMTGEELKEDAKDTALDEIITIGNITNSVDADPEKVEELIDYIKAEVIAKGLDDPEEIKDVIEKAGEKFDIDLSEEQKQELTDVMDKIADLDIDPETLLKQAGDLYDKYGDTILSEAKAAVDGVLTDEVKASLWQAVVSFFKTLFDSVKNYISSK